MIKCELCGEEKTNRKGLSYHCKTRHGMKFEDYVVRFEHGGVRPTCKHGCGQETRFLGGRFMDYVNGHQMIGVPKSAKTKQKISETQTGRELSEEHKGNIAIGMKRAIENGAGNIESMMAVVRGVPLSEDHRRKLGATRSAKIASGEIVINCDKISATVTQKYLDGGFEWSRGKHVSPKLLGRPYAYYRSSWELRHMMAMDQDPFVLSYHYEPMVLFYEWEGKSHRYVPDFLVSFADGHRELQEVGVKHVKNLARNVEKAQAAREWCARQSIPTTFRIVSL